jgi:Arc/MetJ family transcription regulator
MRTTLNLKDELIEKAMQLANIKNKTEIIHLALKSLIAEYSRERLIALGGSDKKLSQTPRRR